MEKRLRSVIGADVRTPGAPDDLIQRAALLGFTLANFESETGQLVWEWRQGDGPRPQFATERVARQWMAEWIERTTGDRPDALAARRPQRDVPPLPAVVPESA